MKELYSEYRNEINKAAFITVLLLVFYVFIKYVLRYIAPFVVGYIISLLLLPLVNLLSKTNVKVFNKRKYLPRSISSLIALAVFIFLISFLGTSIVLKLITQGREYAAVVPGLLTQLREYMDSISVKYYQYTAFIPIEMQTFFDDQISAISGYATALVGSGVKQGSVNLVVIVPNIIVSIFLGLISAFFFMKDKAYIKDKLADTSPKWLSEKMKVVRAGLGKALTGYFKAQFTLAAINACICVVGLTILRYPYALFVGVGISLIDMLPIFGAGAILWPWAAFSLLAGNIPRATGLIIIYGLILVTRQILEPKLLGDNIGLHPLATLMSLYIGLKVFGVFGLIMGPVLVIMIKAVWETPAAE